MCAAIGAIGYRALARIYCVGICVFFFFQAEDGIRDLTVTGVQTCALPISVTIPCAVAPLAAVNATLRLTSNKYRTAASLDGGYAETPSEGAMFDARFATKIGRASCRERV